MIDPDSLFSLTNSLALIGWALMIFTPNWKWARALINSLVLSLFFAGIYALLLFSGFSLEDFSANSLADVRAIFNDDHALLAGWIHYLSFDLLVGTWIWNNARKVRIHHFLVIPCLFFTLMTGPFGLLLYWIVRLVKQRSLTTNENFS